MNKTLIIGAGNLGSNIAYGFIGVSDEKRPMQKVYIYDTNKKKEEQFEQYEKNIIFVKNLSLVLKKSKIIILAIKPKDFKDVCEKIKECINKDAIVLSVMAGIKISSLKKELPHNTKFVRLMTNLNIQVFQGITAIYANNKVKNVDKKRIETFWSALGEVYWLKSESKINDFTALIGSGPAYFIYFCECLVNIYKNFGLSKKDATLFVHKLMIGTAFLTDPYFSDIKYNQAIKKIASKGGTTEEALKILQKGQFASILNKSIKAAYEKAKSLDGK